MASIYDESGTEIENAELLFTEEGLCIITIFLHTGIQAFKLMLSCPLIHIGGL